MKSKIKQENHKWYLYIGVAACALSFGITPASGQVSEGAKTQEPIIVAQNEDDVNELDEVIVTGSRIKRGNFETPSPVTILGSELIEESGFASLGDVLLRSPVVAVGQGLSNAQTASETAGATFANLRGLGSFRTLTLVNGRRRVPGDFTSSSVDLSSIPPSMVERVEIVTGGTSAVYGADAVTGVINVILKKNFEGLELDVSAGLPEAGGGGGAQKASLHWGQSFDDDRGHISVGLAYNNSELLRASERDFSSGSNFLTFQTNVPGESFDGVVPSFTVRRDPTTFLFAEGGTFWFFNGSVFEYYTVDPDLRQQTNDAPPFTNQFNGILGNGWASGGDGFSFAKYGLLRGGLETFNGMADFTYDIGDNTEFYANIDITSSTTESPFQPNFHPANGDFLFARRDNPLLSQATQDFMDARGLTSLFVQKTHEDLGVRNTFVDRLNYTFSSGVRGTFNNGWDYEVFGQYGEMNIDTRTENTLIRDNYLNAVDVISDPVSGAPVCRDVDARAAGCTPLKILGRNGPLTQEQRDFVLHDKETNLDLTQVIFGAQLTGDIVELPAGMIGFATGVEYREETLDFTDDPLNTAGRLLLNSPTEATNGKVKVSEIFGEVIVPIIADKPFFKNVQVEGALRYSDYSQTESTLTWKIGGSWDVSDDIRFRVTRSLSIRAPTITNLFSPGIASFSAVTDPCDATVIGLIIDDGQRQTRTTNCQALGLAAGYVDPTPTVTKEIITGGNPDLDPEDSYSWTAGVILTPSFIEGLKISVDFWDIDMSGVISSLGIGAILNNCVDFTSTDNDFCPLITRDGTTGEILSIRNTNVNIDKQRAKGFDFQMNYNFNPDWVPGYFELYGAATLLDEFTITDVSPAGDFTSDEVGEILGTPLPKWRGNVSIAYNQGPFRINWFGNYIGGMIVSNSDAPGTYQPGFDRVGSVFYHYVSVKYKINEKMSVQGGVNNLFDKSPPANPFTFLGAGGLYDNNGRYFWLGATAKF